MTAELVPFPVWRRRPVIVRLVDLYLTASRSRAERALVHEVEKHRRFLLSAGAPHLVADAEARALKSAVRAELDRLALGGVA